jgi:uncharacterized membrane protein YfbV (UPF0208 family)
MSNQNLKMTTEELLKVLEPLVRRVVREELTEILQQFTKTVYILQESPLYRDMQDILVRKASQELEFMTHEEVWRE